MRKLLSALLLGAAIAGAQETTKPEAPKPEAPQAAPQVAHIEILKVKLSGEEDPFPEIPFGKPQLNFRGFLDVVAEIARDPDVDAVELKLDSYGVGWARLLETREALAGLRRAGKKVFVYKENFSTPDLVLASVADRISVPESGMVVLPGLALESWYMKDLLAKLHLSFDVVHIGEYKSAGESLVRDSMSDELKESLDPILDEFFKGMVDSIAEGRGISRDVVLKAIDKGILLPREAQAMGLVDRVEYYDQFKEGVRNYFPDKQLKKAEDRLKKRGPQFDPNNPFAIFSVVMGALMEGSKERLPEGPKVAVIYCSGAIVSGKSQYDWMGNIAAMGSETIVAAIDKARENDEVKAIVLRVNSPGGSALASDMIWRAIERAKAKKPVIASMGDVAASGGYYISCNSHVIVAEPQTITGSIGVVGMMPNVDQFYPWVGINPQRMSRGKRAEMLMTTKGLTDDGKEMIRDMMRSVYEDFVGKVAAGRGKSPAEIEPVARGRVWTGRDALARGLVDEMGGLDRAVAVACKRAGVEGKEGKDWHVVEWPRRKGPLDFLEDMFDAKVGIDDAVLAKIPELRQVLARLQVLRLVARDRICVIDPELTGFANAFTGLADR